MLVCLVSRHCNFHGDYLFVFEACYLSFQMPNTQGSGIDFLVNTNGNTPAQNLQ